METRSSRNPNPRSRSSRLPPPRPQRPSRETKPSAPVHPAPEPILELEPDLDLPLEVVEPEPAAKVREIDPAPPVPAPGAGLDSDALRQALQATKITTVADYLRKGMTLEDYRSALWMYLDRYVKTGEMAALAKAIVKTAALRDYLLERGEGG